MLDLGLPNIHGLLLPLAQAGAPSLRNRTIAPATATHIGNSRRQNLSHIHSLPTLFNPLPYIYHHQVPRQ